ncbi:MAG TPA: heparinase II/III family protein [Gemmatimonadaceae bacterium]|nr:heparinase II/III family protein [Gemmatimonadaceae bacterium]
MTVLLDGAALSVRAAAVRGPLAPLVASLRADLEPLVTGTLAIPEQKALLSRDGGRCPHDGTMLAFDPFSPHAHRCPTCGTELTGERHDLWWVTWQHLWLAERAVHAAALHALTGEPALATLAAAILRGYAERYASYPNRDNALGPTRPFFSTYLESIWMLQLAIATDLLEQGRATETATGAAAEARGVGALVRDALVAPSAALIASFDEGSSNRQVWNNAAMLAAGRLLDDHTLVHRAVHGASGLRRHLETALLPDGTWYEGDNYHLFAHRGLWYGVVMADAAGIAVAPESRARFQEGFAAPLLTALPDFTFPSRRDSPYRVSLRQWRFAESCELGVARAADPRLLGALHTLYHTPAFAGDTGRHRSTAEAERNEAPVALSRADLGWRALLFALPELPPLHPVPARSVLLDAQGFAVMRRDGGRAYVALDYGHAGGGHGHPDRLDLLLAVGTDRWLDDPGTGSYVDPTLHWYRSTLAHNAPLVNGRSQTPGEGALRAWDERGAAGWVRAELPEGRLAPHVQATRTVVVMDGYLIDRVEWLAAEPARFELPVHVDARADTLHSWHDAPFTGGEIVTDGFAFVRAARTAEAAAGEVVHLRRAPAGEAWLTSSTPASWWRVLGPAPPGDSAREREFLVLRQFGVAGTLTGVWSWGGEVRSIALDGDQLLVHLRDGAEHAHAPEGEGAWRIRFRHGAARSSIVLEGARGTLGAPPSAGPLIEQPAATRVYHLPRAGSPPLLFHLGAHSYRRTEDSWEEAGGPRAVVRLHRTHDTLEIAVDVLKEAPIFRAADAPDPALDNEHPDIHSDGVQFYVDRAGWDQPIALLAVPEEGGTVRTRWVDGTRRDVPVHTAWDRTPAGYAVRFSLPLAALGDPADDIPLRLDVLVNETSAERVRRRGQLVLSGAAGEFGYLRGDRQPRERYLHLVIPRAR